jgi:hypothetical protein
LNSHKILKQGNHFRTINEALPNELSCTHTHGKNALVHFDLLKTGLIWQQKLMG